MKIYKSVSSYAMIELIRSVMSEGKREIYEALCGTAAAARIWWRPWYQQGNAVAEDEEIWGGVCTER